MAKHKLLLADDSITIQKVVNLTFADEGIEVISVGDGNSALEKFSEFTPDLVMADINMPGLSGYELCELVKQSDETSHIPVILLVGSFEPFDEEEAQRVGANDYLTKPFQSIRQLVNKVSALLNSADADADAPTDEFAVPVENNELDSPQSVSDENYQTRSAPADSAEQLGDAGMDDEMIQTNQGGFGFDETQKFTTKGEFEEEDYAKTKPLSAEDLNEIREYQTSSYDASGGDEPEQLNQKEYSSADQDAEQDFENQESSLVNGEAYQSSEYPTEEFTQETEGEFGHRDDQNSSANALLAFSNWELDEINLLELPPGGGFSEQVENLSAQKEITASKDSRNEIRNGTTDAGQRVEAENTDEPIENANLPENRAAENEALEKSSVSASSPTNLSQSDIDAIAQRVVEKISDKVVSQLAPEIADLLIKRIAEEKLKE